MSPQLLDGLWAARIDIALTLLALLVGVLGTMTYVLEERRLRRMVKDCEETRKRREVRSFWDAPADTIKIHKPLENAA